MSVVVETKVGKKRVIVIPKVVAETVKIHEGQKVRIIVVEGKISRVTRSYQTYDVVITLKLLKLSTELSVRFS